MDLRYQLVNASIDAIRLEIGAASVQQFGTRVELDGPFKVPRMLEAALRVICNDMPEELVKIVARGIEDTCTCDGHAHDLAYDIIASICNYLIDQLDPMP
jgi:hypothetical protein